MTKVKWKNRMVLVAVFGAILLLLAACGGRQGSGPAAAVEAYLNALVSKDSAAVANGSCAAWEAQAGVEYDSFAAVTARLENLACQEGGKSGDFTLVTCTGRIIANYNGEDQAIDLSARTYQTVQEGGDWRICGYQ